MENRAHALVAGIFVIFLSITIGIVAMWFSGEATQREKYRIVSTEPVTGLNPQAAVHYRGVTIGKVENIQFDPENLNQILVDISVDEKINLPKNVYAQLGYQGVTGLAYIQLNDDGTVSEKLPSDARIPMRRSLLDEVAGSGQDLLSNINELVKKMHLLLSEQNQKQISHILQNIEKSTGRFDNIAEEMQPVLRSFSGLTIETNTLVQHLNQLLAEINQVVDVNQQGGLISSITQSAEELAITIPEFRKASDGITRNSQNLNRVLRQFEENPQSLLFGRSPPLPGPGEDGFKSPIEAAK